MPIKIRDAKQFIAGLLFMAIGIAAGIEASSYRLGTVTAMGPGYYPVILSWLLTGLGAVTALRALFAGERVRLNSIRPVPVLAVAAATIVFGLLVESYGLVAAVVAATVVSSYAQLLKRPLEVVVMAAVLAGTTGLLFVYTLGLPLKLF